MGVPFAEERGCSSIIQPTSITQPRLARKCEAPGENFVATGIHKHEKLSNVV
jgi:hypothetical protein